MKLDCAAIYYYTQKTYGINYSCSPSICDVFTGSPSYKCKSTFTGKTGVVFTMVGTVDFVTKSPAKKRVRNAVLNHHRIIRLGDVAEILNA
jgi:hypothetical protein